MSDKENPRSDCAVRIAVRERPFSSEELAGNVLHGVEKYSDGSNVGNPKRSLERLFDLIAHFSGTAPI